MFSGRRPPVPEGEIVVDGNGRIAAIGRGIDREALDLGEVALVPALVNPHTHLEFSDLPRPIAPAQPFPRWIEQVVASRAERRLPVGAAIARGLREVRRGGTQTVGEIAAGVASDAYQDWERDGEFCLFHEILGPREEDWPQRIASAATHLRACAERPGLTGGLSPHAPYTVPQGLFEKSIELAKGEAAPVAVHLAESASERELLNQGSGELVEMMRRFGAWDERLHPPGRQFADWLVQLAECERGLVIHGNYLKDEELDVLAAHENLTLVYCPRTHAYFGHPPHPFLRLRERGGRVALGTDGRCSNPNLSLWAEAHHVRRKNPSLSSGTILKMITQNGAEALGMEDHAGILDVGREANFLAIECAGSQTGIPRPPEDVDLFQEPSPAMRVFRRGIEIERARRNEILVD